MSRTHRCRVCPLTEEHEDDELCTQCGLCAAHCLCIEGPQLLDDDFDADELGIDPEERFDA